VSRVERNRGLGRGFEKAVRRKPLARRTRALCKLYGAKERWVQPGDMGKIKYFTALVSARPNDPDQPVRQ
jgi:hypothetical protein